MNSRPIGVLGGGGWEAGQVGPLPGASPKEGTPGKDKRDKVLTDMYEMFLDSMEAEIIQSVVQSCGYNHKKSVDALLDMCGSKDCSDKSAAQSASRNASREQSKAPSQNSGKSQNSSSGMTRIQSSSSSAPHNSTNPFYPLRENKKKGMDLVGNDKMTKVKRFIEKKYRIMILMRGCPGSGKSYLAEELILSYGGKPKDYVFSTDDYFMRNNVYLFKPAMLGEAHQWNQTRVMGKIREGHSPIIIDNTNTQMWEMTGYASMAINHGYAIEILEPDTPWFFQLGELTKRNRHNVPRENIRSMLERYERSITVEHLIRASGAKYSKIPPRAAEKALIPQAVRTENEERATNPRPSAARSEQSFQNSDLLLNFSPVNNYSGLSGQMDPPNFTSPDTARSLTGGDGFYFGSNTSNQSGQDAEGQGPSNAPNPLPKKEESGFKLFRGDIRTRIVPLRPKGFDICDKGIGSAVNTSVTDSSASQINLTNIPLSLNLKPDQIELNDPSILSAVKSKNATIVSETEENNQVKTQNPSIQNSEDISTESTVHSVFSLLPIKAFENTESKNDKLDRNSSEVFVFNSFKSNEGSFGSLSLSSLNLVSKETSTDQVHLPINWEGTADWTVQDKTKTDNLVQQKSIDSSVDWMGTADWDVGNKSGAETSEQNALPKPPRKLSFKKIDDYCQSVKDMNAATPSEVSKWLFSENSSASWTPIDKVQEETFTKEKSLNPLGALSNLQRSKFKKCDVLDKTTNTHYTDFSTPTNIASNVLMEGVTVLDTHDRDINEGRIFSEAKVSLKLMLDKGTLTENDFEVEMKKENKQEKIKELARLFPNRPLASLKELLKLGNWDVNYVSNLLLDDTDNDACGPYLAGDGNIDSDSDEESSALETSEVNKEIAEALGAESGPVCDNNPTAQEEAEEIKRHIEQSINFSERSYSPHLLAIKNSRRGVREGAIPKTSFPACEESATFAIETANEFKETTPESYQVTSESSDGDECNETLEFIIGQDFIQQLADKFGGSCNVANVSPLVKFPVNLARKIHDIIFTSNASEEEEDNEDLVMKLQCEEDERMAHQLYEEMMNNADQRVESTAPQLREIMDMELARAIYKADLDSLTQGSQDLMANVLAKRLLEENYSKVDKKVLHDIFASCNNSFEDTVKTLQEALSTDDEVFTDKGRAQREKELINQAKQSSLKRTFQDVEPYSNKALYSQTEYEIVEDSVDTENPWDLSDPKAHYQKSREKADHYLKERDSMYSKANDAFRRKQRSVAAYYARLGELNGKKYQHASAMAAAALAAAQTNAHCSDTLDLHHFKVAEAVTVFDLFIDYQIRLLSERAGTHSEGLNIITGRGTHSVNGKPKIRPAILNRAKKRNLRTQTAGNPGVVRVWVASDSRPSHEIP